MPATNPQDLTPQELVVQLKQIYGYTWKEMGERLGRSEKMLRKVATGQSRGESYRQSLTELYDHGEVTHRPARRKSKDGRIVPVRAKAGAAEKTLVPEETAGTFKKMPKKGTFRSTVADFGAGGRQYTVDMPKSARSKGRKAGLDSLKQHLRTISRSQARQDKRIKFEVTYQVNGVGRVMEVGSKSGYHASDVLSDVKTMHDGDMSAWLAAQSQERYENLDVSSSPIVSVSMTVFNAKRSKDERKMQDQAGVRRKRRR